MPIVQRKLRINSHHCKSSLWQGIARDHFNWSSISYVCMSDFLSGFFFAIICIIIILDFQYSTLYCCVRQHDVFWRLHCEAENRRQRDTMVLPSQSRVHSASMLHGQIYKSESQWLARSRRPRNLQRNCQWRETATTQTFSPRRWPLRPLKWTRWILLLLNLY